MRTCSDSLGGVALSPIGGLRDPCSCGGGSGRISFCFWAWLLAGSSLTFHFMETVRRITRVPIWGIGQDVTIEGKYIGL